MKLRLVILALAAALLACTGSSSDTGGETSTCDGKLHTEVLSLKSDREGRVTVPVPLDGNDDAFMVLTAKGGGTLSTDGVIDGDGATALDWEDWSSSHDSLTNAFYATSDISVLNWPVRDEDGPLSAGDWTVMASTLDNEGYYLGNQSVEVTVVRRSCGGGDAGLPVTVVYAGGLERDREVKAAVEAASERWAALYAAYGITIEVAYASADVDGSLPEPLVGADEYTGIYEAIGEGVVVVVGDDLVGSAELYGESGGIPGPLVASPHSVVAVSWLVHAGPDAAFSDEEIEILAETMAHESGHFLGLFHPVESTWTYWDALDDTKKCAAEGSCESALADNLMFPYPVCAGSCVRQDELTTDQVGVLLNNVGVQ